MSAPTMDRVLPPIVFMVAFMSLFILLVLQMNVTMQSNLNNQYVPPSAKAIPDYLAIFQNGSSVQWSYNSGDHLAVTNATPYEVNYPNIYHDYDFTWAGENGHNLQVYLVRAHFGDLSANRHEIDFLQEGGWLGMQQWEQLTSFPGNYEVQRNQSGAVIAYTVEIALRHTFLIELTGYSASHSTLADQILSWKFNMTVHSDVNMTTSTNPWVIVGQLFSFNLPGVPLWLNALLLAPIMVTVGIVAYIIIRGVFPG